MNYWLLKSEPASYSWDQLVKDGRTNWNGVRNATAVNNLKAMKKGDRAFFYHSNEGLEIVGIAEILREFYPDPADKTGRFGMVDLRAVEALPRPVTLEAIKAEPRLAAMVLANNSRLSVQPVTEAEWAVVREMGGLA